MCAALARHIIIADRDLSHLGWLVQALREAGHAVFPVSDGEGIVSIAQTLSHVDLLIADRQTPTASGIPLDQLVKDRLPGLTVVYWDPGRDASPDLPAQLLAR